MAFLFMASQGVNERYNEDSTTPHRPRLDISKTRSNCDNSSDVYDSNLYADSAHTQTLYSTLDYAEDPELVRDSSNSYPEYVNNNDQSVYNFNKLNQCDSTEQSPNFDILLDWPLDSSIKTRRLSQVRKQMKQLSSAIQMTIDPATGKTMASLPAKSHIQTGFLESCNVKFAKPPKVTNLPELLKNDANSLKDKDIKNILRENHWDLTHPIRKDLWMSLIQTYSADTPDEDFYLELVRSKFGSDDLSKSCLSLPPFVHKDHRRTYGLTEEGILICDRLMGVLYYNDPTITFAPSIYPIAALLLHYMSEHEVFHCMTVLISGKGHSFIPQSKLKYVATFRTFQQLCKKNMRPLYTEVRNSPDLQQSCYMNWMFWVFEALPFVHVVRVMDCFLYEGHKALFRTGMTVFNKWMHGDPSRNPYLTTLGPFTSCSPLEGFAWESADKMLKSAYGIRGISQKLVAKLIMINEEHAMKVGVDTLMTSCGDVTLPDDQETFIPESQPGTNELYTMFKFLRSPHLAERTLKLAYTTREDGNTLTSFYRKVQDYNELFLVVKENDRSMFGAYLSAPLRTRNCVDEHGNIPRYFGTGESFIFRLRPKVEVYPWVVEKMQQQNKFLSNYENSLAQFIYAGQDMLCIGGGDGQGIMLDHDFENGKSEPCKTFNNPQLSEKTDFKIMAVEAYCLDTIV